LPERFWSEVIELARIEGIAQVARALGIDCRRIKAQMGTQTRGEARAASPAESDARFVELDTKALCPPARTVVRIERRDGERMEIELGAGASLDVVGLVRTVWD
jgi:hypothetical protein